MSKSLNSLMDLVSYMRGNQSLSNALEGGCPWHKELTLNAIADYLRGETQELLEAISPVGRDSASSKKEHEHLKEELGDVLLQILMICEIMKERKAFDFDDVCRRLEKKLRFRSPHLFEKVRFSSMQEIEDLWKQRKKMEKETSS